MEGKESPPCAGTYEDGNRECDGGVKQKACAWRKACRSLRDYCTASGEDPARLAQLHDRDTLECLVEQVSDTGFVDGTLADVFAKEERKEPRRRDRFEKVWPLHEHFQNLLIDRFGEGRFANILHTDSARVVILRPGTIYPIDRTGSANYVTWLCKAPLGRDAVIARVYLKGSKKNVDVQLPFPYSVISDRVGESTLKKLNPSKVKDGWPGWRKCSFRGLGMEGVGIAVGVIKRLYDLGNYELPDFE